MASPSRSSSVARKSSSASLSARLSLATASSCRAARRSRARSRRRRRRRAPNRPFFSVGRDLGSGVGQVADVADAGLDDVARARGSPRSSSPSPATRRSPAGGCRSMPMRSRPCSLAATCPACPCRRRSTVGSAGAVTPMVSARLPRPAPGPARSRSGPSSSRRSTVAPAGRPPPSSPSTWRTAATSAAHGKPPVAGTDQRSRRPCRPARRAAGRPAGAARRAPGPRRRGCPTCSWTTSAASASGRGREQRRRSSCAASQRCRSSHVVEVRAERLLDRVRPVVSVVTAAVGAGPADHAANPNPTPSTRSPSEPGQPRVVPLERSPGVPRSPASRSQMRRTRPGRGPRAAPTSASQPWPGSQPATRSSQGSPSRVHPVGQQHQGAAVG